MTRTLVFHTLQPFQHDFNKRHADPSQPPLMGLVAALLDEGGELGRMMRLIELPEGVSINDRAQQETGITPAMVDEWATPLEDAIREFRQMMEMADWIAAYSVEHHASVVNVAAKQCDLTMPTVALYCLMKKSTNVCKLPSRMTTVYKMPKLAEAYAFFARKDYEVPYGASAMEILDFHIRARNLIFRGIKLAEAQDLKKAGKPLVKSAMRSA